MSNIFLEGYALYEDDKPQMIMFMGGEKEAYQLLNGIAKMSKSNGKLSIKKVKVEIQEIV